MSIPTSTPLPTSMKAWQFSSTTGGMQKNLTLNSSAPLPPSNPLKASHSLIRVIATSVNPADYKVPELAGRLAVKYPATPGMDYSGVIVSTTNPALKPGQSVFGRLDVPNRFGTLAQYVVAPPAGTAPIPDGVDPLQAACLGTAALTAYQCIAPHVKQGDHVFINGGSGGTGTFGIQVAKNLGCKVTTTCSTGNVGLCKDMGADEVIDYKTTPNLSQKLSEEGQRFSLVVDNVGTSTDLYAECHHFVTPQGKFVQVGAEVSVSGAVKLASRMLRPSILGGGKRKFQFVNVANDYDGFVQLAQWMKQGTMRAVVSETVEFADAPRAYELLRGGRTRGKIVIKVSEGEGEGKA